MDDEAPRRREIRARDVEALLRLGAQAALDLDRPPPALGQVEHQVDLGAGRGPVEARLGARRRNGEEVLDHESLPTRPTTGCPASAPMSSMPNSAWMMPLSRT